MASTVEVIVDVYSLSHFLARTDSYFAGKCSCRASLRRTANAAGQLDERLFTVADIDDAAVVGDAKAHRGALMPGVIEGDGVVMNDLDGGVHLLHLHRDRHRRSGRCEIMVDVD